MHFHYKKDKQTDGEGSASSQRVLGGAPGVAGAVGDEEEYVLDSFVLVLVSIL